MKQVDQKDFSLRQTQEASSNNLFLPLIYQKKMTSNQSILKFPLFFKSFAIGRVRVMCK